MNIAQAMPYLEMPFNVSKQSFDDIFGSAKIMYVSSVTAYLFGSLADIWLFGILKKATKGTYERTYLRRDQEFFLKFCVRFFTSLVLRYNFFLIVFFSLFLANFWQYIRQHRIIIFYKVALSDSTLCYVMIIEITILMLN